MVKELTVEDIRNILNQMGEKALTASRALALLSPEAKDKCLQQMADAIEGAAEEIKAANQKDLKTGKAKGLSDAMLDRLELTDARIKAMADGLRTVAVLDDPVGRKLSSTVRPNGIRIDKISVPIGVIGIIFESRPNVTVDAAGLCLKAGNAVILRGGSEAINSNLTLAHCLNRAGVIAGLPDGAVQLIPVTDRRAVGQMVKMDQYIDLIIPRGGEGLIRAVVEQSTIPVIKHYKGVCHLYVDADADLDMALRVTENGKCQRPGVCNALETLLINEKIADKFVPPFVEVMRRNKVELRGDSAFCAMVPEAKYATEEDYYTEYIDLIFSVKLVPDTAAAIWHINHYGSHHSDAIITENPENAEMFLRGVDSATVYHNASTRFTDGFEFGMGAEIGISTDKLHARGPMGLEELTSYKYIVYGNGQIRT
ncbi:MAG: glutamate-5-semialdehyde dehydrogenase [Victivallaceae bacterium]|nr:glutamate-5-semialdehyde dehydrogenase [Victivallaceae bacterium]